MAMPTPETQSNPVTDAVQQRRALLDEPPLQPGPQPQMWGLALSGGGVRSATFCFGLLVALARNRALLRFDLLSTVSGGGFIGALLGRLFDQSSSAQAATSVQAAIADADNRWFAWWLRANGHYLFARGARDVFVAVATMVRNLLALHIELALVAMAVGTLLASVNLATWAWLNSQWHPSVQLGGEWISVLLSHLPNPLPTLWLLWVPLMVTASGILACAYWALPQRRDQQFRQFALLHWSVWAIVMLCLVVQPAWLADLGGLSPQMRTGSMLMSLCWLMGIPWGWWQLLRCDDDQERVRARVTSQLSAVVMISAVMALLGVVDRLAWFIAFDHPVSLQLGAALLALAALLRTVLAQLGASSGAAPAWLGSKLLTLAHWAGLLVTLALTACWVSVLYSVVFDALFEPPQQALQFGRATLRLALIAAGVFGFLAATGRQVEFANLSSLHRYYKARLVRGWLGAANPARFDRVASTLDERPPEPADGYRVSDVSTVVNGDDVDLVDYSPHTGGGPLHLINVCLNQTVASSARAFNRDRKGQSLTVMPGAQMRLAEQPWQAMPADNAMSLGSWTAISGAAFAPGLGTLTRSGISALAMFAGVRLGYWWQPYPPGSGGRKGLSLFAKSALLVGEMMGRFRGDTGSAWYLSDGGHFENTAAYALLRERCRLIVLADCGADPLYRFEDLENLVRKARVDLGADIQFLKPESDDPPAPYGGFGSVSDLASAHSDACLALAEVRYAGGGMGHLVLVKPNMFCGLPVDLLNFKGSNPAFPQQTTADQSYDEAQWESHFVLGREIGQWLTPELLQSLAGDDSPPFVPDDGKPLKCAADTAAAKDSHAARLPVRLGVSAVSASIGLGTAATLGVTVWQGIDSIRTASRQGTDADDKALKELTDLWGKMATPPAAAAASDAAASSTTSTAQRAATAGPLASALLRIGDTLCPNGFNHWFATGYTAQYVLDDARYACQDLQAAGPGVAPPACLQLLHISNPAHCLYRPPDLVPGGDQRPACLPHYWGRDYRLQPSANVVGNCPKLADNLTAQTTATAAPAATAPTPPVVSDAVGSGAAAAAAADSASASAPEPVPVVEPLAPCLDNTLYLQVYGLSRKNDEVDLRIAFARLDKRLAPTEDMNASASFQHRPPPTPVRADMVRWHDASGKACAQAVAAWLTERPTEGRKDPKPAVAEAIAQQYVGQPKVVEIWLAP
jgi:cell division septation protein DedD